MTVKFKQNILHCQIRSQFQGMRKIPFVAKITRSTMARNITCTLRANRPQSTSVRPGSAPVRSWRWGATDSREANPFQAQQLFLTSLRTTPDALLELVRDRWSIEGWH